MKKKIKVKIIEESLWDRLPQHVKDEINGIINSKPKEMVEVVQCKDCKWNKSTPHNPICSNDDMSKDVGFFCADGERRIE